MSALSGLGGLPGSGFDQGGAAVSPSQHELAPPQLGPDSLGGGVAVRLPDGSTAMAPNPVAASAVRHALPQLGVPYVWGGTTAGVGLDCTGLTQWAYHEAGLNIPRLPRAGYRRRGCSRIAAAR